MTLSNQAVKSGLSYCYAYMPAHHHSISVPQAPTSMKCQGHKFSGMQLSKAASSYPPTPDDVDFCWAYSLHRGAHLNLEAELTLAHIEPASREGAHQQLSGQQQGRGIERSVTGATVALASGSELLTELPAVVGSKGQERWASHFCLCLIFHWRYQASRMPIGISSLCTESELSSSQLPSINGISL